MAKQTEKRLKWMVSNVAFVGYEGARLWCHLVIIDLEPEKGLTGPELYRKVYLRTWGGEDIATFWIDDGCEVKLTDEKGGRMVLMSCDGNPYNLDGGAILEAGKLRLRINRDDFRKPLNMQFIDKAPWGDEADDEILKYSGGVNYPKTVWVAIKDKEKAQQAFPNRA